MKKMEKSQLFEKANQNISIEFIEKCTFLMLILMVFLLLVENFLMAYFAIRYYDTLFFIVGLVILAFTCLTAYHRVQTKELKPIRQWSITEYALLFFFIWCIMAVVFSEDPLYGLLGSSYRKEGLVTYLIYGSVIISAKQITSRKYINCFLWFFGIVGFVLAIVAAINSEPELLALSEMLRCNAAIEDMNSYRSIFYNYNHFAYLLTIVVLVQAGLFVFSKKRITACVSLFMFAVSVAALFRNNTLGCFLAATIGIIFLVCIVCVAEKGSRYGLLLLVLTYTAVFVCTQIYDSSIFDSCGTVKDTLSGENQSFNSTAHRLDMWKQSLVHIAENPIFGMGLDGSGVVAFVGDQDRPHNEYIQYALFMGIPGLLAYLTALISLFMNCIRHLKDISTQGIIMGTVVVGYCASAFVGNSMYYTTVYYVMFLGLLIGNVTMCNVSQKSSLN